MKIICLIFVILSTITACTERPYDERSYYDDYDSREARTHYHGDSRESRTHYYGNERETATALENPRSHVRQDAEVHAHPSRESEEVQYHGHN